MALKHISGFAWQMLRQRSPAFHAGMLINPQPACRSRIQDINAPTVWAPNRLCCPFEACEPCHEGREASCAGVPARGVSFTERNNAALTQGAYRECRHVTTR